MPPQPEVTELLVALREGQEDAMDRLFPLVYEELHRIAHRQRRARRAPPTLSTTALVHEAYLKLVDPTRVSLHDRDHFFAVAATAMRHILVDYARRRQRLKRGGGAERVSLDDRALRVDACAEDVLALEQALARLETLSERLGRVVELRFFGGLSLEETAGVLGVSERTVKRDWRKARAFLARELHAPA